MPEKHIVVVQFQEGHNDIVSPKTFWSSSPIPASKVVGLLNELRDAINFQVRDDGLKEKTFERIDKLIRWIERQKLSNQGPGLGQNWKQEEIYHRDRTYRIDIELSGEIFPG